MFNSKFDSLHIIFLLLIIVFGGSVYKLDKKVEWLKSDLYLDTVCLVRKHNK